MQSPERTVLSCEENITLLRTEISNSSSVLGLSIHKAIEIDRYIPRIFVQACLNMGQLSQGEDHIKHVHPEVNRQICQGEGFFWKMLMKTKIFNLVFQRKSSSQGKKKKRHFRRKIASEMLFGGSKTCSSDATCLPLPQTPEPGYIFHYYPLFPLLPELLCCSMGVYGHCDFK